VQASSPAGLQTAFIPVIRIIAKKVMKAAAVEALGLLERGWAILYTEMGKVTSINFISL
jgi:hypothetical protein